MNLITIEQAERVLNRLRAKKPNEISSHDFIEEYSLWREDDYIDWLNSYRGTGRAFWHVHQDIDLFLVVQEVRLTPRYHKIGRRDNENVHGAIDKPMWWAWD